MSIQLASNLLKDSLPFRDKSTNGILQLMQQALSMNGVVRLVVDARNDEVLLWRLASKEELEARDVTFSSILRAVDMEEYVPEEGKSSFEQMFEVFDIIADAGRSPTHILSGASIPRLRTWIPVSRKGTSMYGLPLVLGNGLEEDVLIVCGAKSPDATPEDVSYAVKITIDLAEDK